MSNIQSINISDIDLSLLVRERNDEYVADLQDVLAQGTPLPPVRIANVKEENTHYLIDGHHRTEARKRNGATEIDAIITEMSKQDARWEAFGANRANGRPLTNAEKRVAIVQMYDEFPSATSRDFATQIGCSHQTAIKVISEMFDEQAREAKRKAREAKHSPRETRRVRKK